MRASLQAVSVMIPEATDWIVASDADVAVCPQCLGDDDAAGTPRFRRREWAQCWQVLCVRHRLPLVDMRGWRSGRLELEPVRADIPMRRNVNGRIVALGRQGNRKLSGRAAMSAIAQMEVAIRGALGGRRPHAPSWGDIEPAGFLRVVCDVTTFVLSGFVADDAGAPLCVRDLHRFRARDSIRCFERLRKRQTNAGQGGFTGLARLAHVGEVGWRRCALFWARELMHVRTERSWLPLPLRRDRHERQRVSLACQSRAAIGWLCERAGQWPERYRRQRWQGLEAALEGCLTS